jgi:hypothetical protein
VTALFREKGFQVCRQGKIAEARVTKLVESGKLNKKFADYFLSAKEKMIRADENLERFSRRQTEIQLRHAEELRLAAWSVLNGERAR